MTPSTQTPARRTGTFSALLLIVSALIWLPASIAQAEVGAQQLPSLNPMLERVTPAVVNISVSGTISRQQNPMMKDPFFRRFFGMPEEGERRSFESAGSGVIVDADSGLIVTNHHVVANAEQIYVHLKDRRRLEATVVGTDPQTDIAVLRVEADNLSDIEMGDSDALRVGDFVVAIGNPFGLGQTATIGIVSATGRMGLGTGGYEDFIQTDASINPGNSGGALVTQDGRLIGINTAILSRSGGNIGIGFAVPINMVRQVVQEIDEYGEVRRGQLGVYIQDLTPELAEAMRVDVDTGAVVTRVVPNSAAAGAGIQTGDVIVSVNGRDIRSGAELRNQIGALDPGDDVRIGLFRSGERSEISATLQRQQQTSAGQSGTPEDTRDLLSGVVVDVLPEEHPLHGQVEGVLVRDVSPKSRAARAGLRPGDIIVSANQTPVSTPDELADAARSAGQRERLLLNIRRGENAAFIVIE